MNFIKTLSATAAIACFSLSASAMQPLAEEQLSDVTGQAISIFGNLDVNIGSVVYTDTNLGNGGSFSAIGVNVTGAIAATLDLLTAANALPEFVGILGTANAVTVLGSEAGMGSVSGTAFSTGFYNGSDVVKIAVPNLGIADGDAVLVDVSIDSMKMGNSGTKSYGSLAVNNVNLQGTKVFIWAH